MPTETSLRRRLHLRAGAAAVALTVAAVAVSGCSGVRRAVGADKIAPDEFRVITKPPLEIPPEYNLRPPTPGEPRPQDLAPSDLAASTLVNPANTQASDAEQLLLAKAGAARAEPVIRAVVDVEAGGVIRKNRGFANRILFWRGGDSADEASPQDSAEDAVLANREELVDAATGGAPIVIRRETGPKLPGL